MKIFQRLLVCGAVLSIFAQPLPVLASELSENQVQDSEQPIDTSETEEDQAVVEEPPTAGEEEPSETIPPSEEIEKVEQPSHPETPQPTPETPSEDVSQPEIKPEVVPLPAQPESVSPQVEGVTDQSVITSQVSESVTTSSGVGVRNQSTSQFILRVGKEARKIGQDHNVYASVMIAQAILESASGNSQLASEPNFNLFGIKGSYEGQSVNFETQEDDGSGNLYMIDAGFKKYPSYKESLEDYGDLITKGIDGSPEFYKGTWKSDAKTYQEATQFLTGRYATDITYNQKLNGLIETYQLTRYDREETSTQAVTHPLPEGGSISSPYGQRGNEFHRGVDLAAPFGNPIVAIKAGVVVTSEFDASWGEYVVVSHEDGMASLYAHQSQRLVKVGDQIEAGEILGLVGSTGNSSGPHLHLETSLDGSFLIGSLINPLNILDQ